MSKFTYLERLKNELRSYEEVLLEGNGNPRFKPNPADVRELINQLQTTRKNTIYEIANEVESICNGNPMSKDLDDEFMKLIVYIMGQLEASVDEKSS